MNQEPTGLARLPKVFLSANLPSHVQTVLRDAILNGALAPGERLLVDEVALHFGVSKIPVREALRALEMDGWVQSQPRRGTYVTPLSRSELREIFEMRRLLEPYSASLAAIRRTDKQLAEMEELLADSSKAIKTGDIILLTETNSRFHSIMGSAAGNKMLSESISKLELQLHRYFISVEWQQRRESMEQHKAIFEAVRDQNMQLAEELTLSHMAHTESLAEASIENTPNAQALGLA